MTLDLDAIEQSARAATPGPWEYVAFRHMQHDVFTPEDDRPLAEGAGTIHCWHAADARHIATANPSTVLALVARVRELEAAILALSDQSGWSAAHYNGCGQTKIGIAGCAACRMDDVADALRAKVRP